MTAPVLAKTIGVKVALANEGEYVIIRNLTRGSQLTQKLSGTDRGTVFNPAPSLAWQDEDLIQAEIRGRLVGVSQKTVQFGGIKFSSKDLGAVTDTDTPGVNL